MLKNIYGTILINISCIYSSQWRWQQPSEY